MNRTILEGSGTPERGSEIELRHALDAEAKRVIVDCTYSGRGHQHAGWRWKKLSDVLGLPTAIGSALLAGSAGVAAVLSQAPTLTAVLAFSAAILSAANGFLRPEDRSAEHSLKGNRFIDLRNEARLFREVSLRSSMSDSELMSRVHELRKRYADLNESPPLQIPRIDYEAARKSIAAGESSYENDPVWKELRG